MFSDNHSDVEDANKNVVVGIDQDEVNEPECPGINI